MKTKNYKRLMGKAEVSDEVELYCIINGRLEEILLKASKKEETVKALLYMFEAKARQTVFSSTMSICFAVLMGLASLILPRLIEESTYVFLVENIMFFGFLIVVILILIACKTGDKEEERILFILGVIKEKYEEIKNESVNKINQEGEKRYYVTVSASQNSFDQKRNE